MTAVDEVLVPDGFFPRHVDIPSSPADAATSLVVVDTAPSIDTVKQQLRALITQLLNVTDVAQAKLLNIEIQRRRVVLILLQETAGIEVDGDYHKEMTLLNRMLQGEDLPEGAAESDAEKAATAAAAEQLLAERGVDSMAAARIIHVLDAIVSRVAHGSGHTPHRQSPPG